MDTIFVYTSEDAIEDGLHIKLSKNVNVTSNLAYTLAPHADGFDLNTLWDLVLPVIGKYYAGVYYDAGATEYPEEADQHLAQYLINDHRVWVMQTSPVSCIIMLPEDY